MIKKYCIVIFTLTLSLVTNGQDISLFLDQVSENNPEIQSYRKLLEAKRLEVKTGRAPSDPFVSFGYMPGNSDPIGTKKIWSVTQSFAFPTKYLLQKKLSRSSIILAEEEFRLGKMLTLLETKKTIIDLVYYEKSLSVMQQRREGLDKLLAAWKKMMDFGEGTVLEYNKILMENSSLNLNITRTETEINMRKNILMFLNGEKGLPPVIIDYPLSAVPDLEYLISVKTADHPSFIIPEKEYLISCEEVKLSRTGSLPEFQVGYSSEIVPGETYAGPVAGMSIPLWSNANRVKTASAIAAHSEAIRDAQLSRLRSEVKREYFNMVALKKSMADISGILKSGENKKFMDIALSNGEISLTTYFSDLAVMYDIEDRLLDLEHEYYLSLAVLMDQELLK